MLYSVSMNAIPFFEQNKHHFERLNDIIKEHSPEGYPIEGNIWFESGANMDQSMKFLHKRMNLLNCSIYAERILEVGFNAGHSAAIMLLANPNSQIVAFDIGHHPYTIPCLEYLRETFGDRIRLVIGDSGDTVPHFHRENPDLVFDLLHIDGGHEELCIIKDVMNCRWLANKKNHIVIVDDDSMPVINQLNRKWLYSGLFDHPLDKAPCGVELFTKQDKTMDHFITRYNFDEAARAIVIARYNRGIDWLSCVNLAQTQVVVMNKGDVRAEEAEYVVCNCKNVGLDQESHLRYIVENYDNLPEIILFTQDDYDKHINHHNVYNTNYVLGDVEFYTELMFAQAKKMGFSKNAFEYDFGDFSAKYEFKLGKECNEDLIDDTFGAWFEKNIRYPFPKKKFVWYKNAIFAVHKKYILSRPKQDYINILNQFTGVKNEIDHFMERSWYYLLNLDKWV